MKNQAIARSVNAEIQALATHLVESSYFAGKFASKLDQELAGRILGILHDFGKYSGAFQGYIRKATGLVDPDIDEQGENYNTLGKVDHSTAGAHYIQRLLTNPEIGPIGPVCAQILATCIASHHSGLINIVSPDSSKGAVFKKRMDKSDELVHLDESIDQADATILQRIDAMATQQLVSEMRQKLKTVSDRKYSKTVRAFNYGFYTRFLFSCLIDADRISSAEFENKHYKKLRLEAPQKPDWNIPLQRLETFLGKLKPRNKIDEIRSDISFQTLKRAFGPKGIYTLSIPTGGGKTYTSLRFALAHAKKHKLDHIFFIIPFTSIIEQNADEVRRIISRNSDRTDWVLEYHSNLEPDKQTWRSKVHAQNWSTPIVFTTMVQFLEACFSGGTRQARRLHPFANSILVFDEIQSLPINCVHLFNNALNFLCDHAGTSAILCTATQPLLQTTDEEKGRLTLVESHELVPDVPKLFNVLERVKPNDYTKPEGWSLDMITELLIKLYTERGSCLVIVNTKKWAKNLYVACKNLIPEEHLFHLSTNQCPQHRKTIINTIKQRLSSDNHQPTVCISTQLIEAGVDIDFSDVVRFLAGLDSIAQAAGRCNRNGLQREKGNLYIVNPANESINTLPDIKEGKSITRSRILTEFSEEELLSPNAMETYFDYYFTRRSDVMDYPIKTGVAINNTLLNLLAENPTNEFRKTKNLLNQSFMAAGKAFKAIDAPTHSVIVYYTSQYSKDGGSESLINELLSIDPDLEPKKYYALLKAAQQFSVNLFPQDYETLINEGAIHSSENGLITYLDHHYYDPNFGVTTSPGKLSDKYIL